MRKIFIIQEYIENTHELNQIYTYAYLSETSAQEECDRLNHINSSNGVEYTVLSLEVKESNSTNFIKSFQ